MGRQCREPRPILGCRMACAFLQRQPDWSRLPPATRRGRPRSKEGPPPRLPVRLEQHPLTAPAGTRAGIPYPNTRGVYPNTPRAGLRTRGIEERGPRPVGAGYAEDDAASSSGSSSTSSGAKGE